MPKKGLPGKRAPKRQPDDPRAAINAERFLPAGRGKYDVSRLGLVQSASRTSLQHAETKAA
jgi:hypothetical protein